jgi:membrane peptidoglycan carboxypeptidase
MTHRSKRRLVVVLVVLLAIGATLWAVRMELASSPIQSRLFSGLARDFDFTVKPGPSLRVRFPDSGPFDQRRGYTAIPDFLGALQASGYVIESQTRLSPRLDAFVAQGGFPIYREKSQAGLTIHDRAGRVLYQARHPERVFVDFDQVPPLIAATLTFIEDRQLLDISIPTRNPAVEWDRLAAAGVNTLASTLVPTGERFGGSTLATQLEKFRHSPEGRTDSPMEKLRQVISASARAYLEGPDTTRARQRIVVDYINSTPLAGRAGFGEVFGLGDGLHVWFGTDLDEAARRLREPQSVIAGSVRSAAIYKQVLSLILAQRRPSYYLLPGRDNLADLTETYLALLADAGVLEEGLRVAASAQPLVFREQAPAPAEATFVERKALNATRAHLLSLLGVNSLYALDRMDLRIGTTLDMTAQRNITDALRHFGVSEHARRVGLYGKHLLRHDPSGIAYSVTLYERGADANLVRVQADNLDQPLDLNEGGMLDLGSTAKLRTLATYLEIVAAVREPLAMASDDALRAIAGDPPDHLTGWAAGYLAGADDRSLEPMLEAAMDRRYSGVPGTFFTGRGEHSFANADKTHNRVMSLRDGFRVSANLVFIRLMRDIVAHYQAQEPVPVAEVLADASHPGRAVYLKRFADMEGTIFVNRFLARYRGLAPDESLAKVAARARPAPHRLATLFRSVRPHAPQDEFARFMGERLKVAVPSADALDALYRKYAPDRFSLQDRGYIAGLHPLELWVVAYLQRHPEATRGEVLAASAGERQAVYGWLFQPRRKGAADRRIRIMAEEDAFRHVHASWLRQGYPFASLVPSLATAIGSSADQPAALAELIGVILNDGVRLPTVHVERIHLAEGTPFETHLRRGDDGAERVFPRPVARILRRSLEDVVLGGTARVLSGVYTHADGSLIPVGGKTGTGDELVDRYGPGTAAGERKEVSRSAAFAFFLGQRHFGVITAHVPGVNVEGHSFTSALPTQVLKALEPALRPLVRDTATEPIAWQETVAEAAAQRPGASGGSRRVERPVKKRTIRASGGQSARGTASGSQRAKRRPPRVVDDLF